MTDEQDQLKRIATAVADGEPIDWEGEDRANARLKSKLARLRTIEKIAQVHRIPTGQGVTPSAELSPTVTIDPAITNRPVPPLPFTQWGHLEVGELLGSGGFGEVYRAFDPHLQKNVALKLVRADRVTDSRSTARFLLEARLLARVTHDNVLKVHGADVHEGRAGLWTDLIEGRTLEEILRQDGRRSSEEAALIGRKMCMALAAVHAEGLIHHDVKTSNIMRGDAGHYVLMDFSTTADRRTSQSEGSAASAPAPHVEPAVPADPRPAIGTPGFMAPERFLRQDSGAASDVYSLGVVLYRLVTGRYPVEGESAKELHDKHCRGESIPLRDLRPDLPDQFIRVVERALEYKPALRFKSIGEMDRALADLIVPGPAPAPEPRPEQPVFPSWKWISYWIDRAPFRAAIALIVVVVGAIMLLNLPTSLDVDARLYRSVPSGERFTALSDEPLEAGAAVAPGDRLYLKIKGNDSMYVYVLNHDEAGVAWTLFPLPGFDLQNPLPEGSIHRLPGTKNGGEVFWVVSSVGGEEEFLVIASREPLENFERQIAAIPEAGSTGRMRGIGGLESSPRPGEGDSWRPLAGIVEGIRQRAENDDGIWTWTIPLRNPGAAGGGQK